MSRVFCANHPGAQDVVGYYSLTFTAWEPDKAGDVVLLKHNDETAPLPTIYLPRISELGGDHDSYAQRDP
jgi:hypothetical protein